MDLKRIRDMQASVDRMLMEDAQRQSRKERMLNKASNIFERFATKHAIAKLDKQREKIQFHVTLTNALRNDLKFWRQKVNQLHEEIKAKDKEIERLQWILHGRLDDELFDKVVNHGGQRQSASSTEGTAGYNTKGGRK